MKIVVNGEASQTRAQTLAELIVELGLGEAKVATALNGAMVRAVKRAATPIGDGDRVEILAPMQGG
ncbi:MAG: thiS [Xanthobacteraceae bacterium]|jgi:sulfur carrier protein|nr:thiS [Xanthobacteraceae bacterium]